MSTRWMPRMRRESGTSGADGKLSTLARRKRQRVKFEFLEERILLSTSIPLNSASWTAVGPAGIGGTSGFGGGNGGPSSGRVTGLATDPTNANILYVAAAGGGVWKSINAGTSWVPLTDSQVTDVMGAIAVSKTNPNVIYAGTGEANQSGDSFYGRGVLKSTDGGATWTLMGSTHFDRKSISKVVISNTDPNTVYVAVVNAGGGPPGGFGVAGGNGIWKSTDGGATWVNTTATITTTDDFSDLVMDPTNSSTLYAAIGSAFGSSSNSNGVYKSIDGGATWKIAGNFPVDPANGRIILAISKTNPNEILASVPDTKTTALKYLLKSTDGGATWSNLTSVLNYLTAQGWYDDTVAIDPNNANVFFAAGVIDYNKGANFIVETTDGGNTWSDITRDAAGNQPHTDAHASAFDANGKLILGTDGGVWRLTNPAPATLAWADINSNLSTLQFTGAALDPTNADVIYAGAQDNGTSKFTDNLRWNQIQGGDGGYTAVDPNNTQTVYETFTGIGITRSDDGGKTSNLINTGISASEPVNFYAPYTLDPSATTHLYFGTDHLYFSNNKGNSWTSIAGPTSTGWTAKAPISWITVAPSDSKTIYLDTNDGKLLASTDGGTTWADRSVPGIGYGLNQILVDQSNPKIVYTVFSDFGAVGHVFKSVNGGVNWTNISGNLPNIPTLTIAVDTRPNSSRIYVGTDTGVFASSDGGTTWAPYKAGLPNAQVVTLQLNTNLNILMAATHGRGVFEIKATDSVSVLPVQLNAVEGTALPASTLVANFNDSTGQLSVSQYTATIDWGDGSPTSAGTIVNLNNGYYGVQAGHTYARFGNYLARIAVASSQGSSGQSTVTEIVADAPLSPNAIVVNSVEGAKFSGVVGLVTDTNSLGLLSDLSATINWGNSNITSGTLTALGGGQFSVSGTNTYATPGSYPVNITVSDLGGSGTTITSTASVADAPLTVTSQTIRTLAGSNFTSVVASFVDTGPADPLASYYANINWGDNTTSSTSDPVKTVTIVNSGIRYDVRASHTYTKYGNYNITVTVGSTLGATATTAPPSQAIVADAPLTASPANFTVVQGQAYTGLVAGFTSTNTSAQPSDFSGTTINWGDATPASSATITANGNGVFGVSGSHTYYTVGNFPVNVSVVSGGGSTASSSGVATVIYAPLTASGTTINGVAGQSITGTVATFTDKFNQANVANFTAQINWGDGQVTDGVVTQPGGVGTTFVVTGTHAWAKPQSYPVTVTILENGNTRDTALSTANLVDAPLTATASPLTPIFEGGTFSGSVGTFTTGNLLAVASDFIATIDWGDGSTSNGTPASLGNGVFTVAPSSPHQFGGQGTYIVGLSVISLGGARASDSTSLLVNPAPINAVQGNSITSVAGQTFSGAVGSFTQYSATPASAFTATIDWGNGDTTPGTVTSNADGSFTVSGTEIYKGAGQFAVGVTVVNTEGGLNATGNFTVPALVTDAPTTAISTPISTIVGVSTTNVVTTLTTTNIYAKASEYSAVIDWGDNTTSAGSVIGGGGTFNVLGTHVYHARSTGYPVTVSVIHTQADGKTGSVIVSNTTARVLAVLAGAITPASDSGYSHTDGITNVIQPVFTGRGEPGSSVQIFTAPTNNPLSTTEVGNGVVDSFGNWTVQVGPLGDGSYVVTAAMLDPVTGIVASKIPVMSTPLTVVTTGPTVAGVTLDARGGLLHVILQPGLGGLNPIALANRANYSLGLPAGTGLQNFTSSKLTTSSGSNGQVVVNLSYNLGGNNFKAGGYVVTLQANGITDLAGNPLVEKNLVTFPQSTNSPNPNYIAQIDVSKTGAASAPHQYVPLSEQIAAGSYSAKVQGTKVVRVPKTTVTKLQAGSTPKPTSFIKAKSKTH